MKKSLIIIIIILILVSFSCKKGSNNVSKTGSNSFDTVTSNLDKGGDLYLYLNSEKVVKEISNFFSKIRKILESQLPPKNKAEFLSVLNLITSTVNEIGLSEINAIGLSTIPVENGLNRSKFVVHHKVNEGKGLIWNLIGESKNLDELELLPEDTVIAEFGNFNPKLLWQRIQKISETSGIKQIKNILGSIEGNFLNLGIDLNKLLNSFSGKSGYILTLNKERKNILPIGRGKTLKIPEPGFALVFSVKNSYIFDLLKKKMPFAKYSEEGETQILSIQVPKLPVTFSPLIIKKDKMLMFLSNKSIFDQINSAKKNKNGLITTDEFKNLSKNIPDKGTGFHFIGKRVFRTLFEIQNQMITLRGIASKEDKVATEFINLLKNDFYFYGVLENGKNGLIYTANHSFSIEKMIVMPVVFTTGVISAIAIPNLVRALQKGKQAKTLGNLKSLGISIEMYQTEFGKYPDHNSFEDLINDENFKSIAGNLIPSVDGWGNEFYYTISEDKNTYFLGSAGKDGLFKGFEQKGKYYVFSMAAFNNDLIYSEGAFIYGPYGH